MNGETQEYDVRQHVVRIPLGSGSASLVIYSEQRRGDGIESKSIVLRIESMPSDAFSQERVDNRDALTLDMNLEASAAEALAAALQDAQKALNL